MNLQNWIEQANRHWNEHRPKEYARLKKAGTLSLALAQAAAQTFKETSELERQGFRPHEAWQMTRERYLFPPEEAPTPDEATPGASLSRDAMNSHARTLEAIPPTQTVVADPMRAYSTEAAPSE